MTEISERPPIGRVWGRVPVVIRAILTGAIAAAAGSIPWSLLVSANTKHWPEIPWAVLPALLYLWLYWLYMRGRGWPRSTAESRRTYSRANRLSAHILGPALFAGALGLATIVVLQRVMNRLVTLPRQELGDLSKYPIVTLALWLITSALVAGVAEEISFRGCMQKPIEERHGPVIAILITGVFFGFAHFGHPEVTLILLPYYVSVAAVYGALAYFTDSILPGMLLHAGGNILGSLDLFTRGRSEWQAPSTPAPLIWQSGADPGFWLSVRLCIVLGAGTVWSYAYLRRRVRESMIHSGKL